jgi:DNA-binding transcriptional MocR family regulator
LWASCAGCSSGGERAARRRPRWSIPRFSNPCGARYGTSELSSLVALCEEHDTHLVCDEPYTQLCFPGAIGEAPARCSRR